MFKVSEQDVPWMSRATRRLYSEMRYVRAREYPCKQQVVAAEKRFLEGLRADVLAYEGVEPLSQEEEYVAAGR